MMRESPPSLNGRPRLGARGFAASGFIALLLAATTGCQQTAALWANISGGDWIDPEFKLTQQPLLILIDDRQGVVTEPRATKELHQTLAENFAEFKVNQSVIPYEEVQRLQQKDREFNRHSIRQIGEKLGAEQVLYLAVDRFTLHDEGDTPVFKGLFSVRVKVLATHRKQEVRLWPNEEAGRLITATTKPRPADGDKSAGDIAAELGIRLGQDVARLFYGHRSLEK